MLNFVAAPQAGLTASQVFKTYRGFLCLTQSELSAQMGSTQTSVARWESEATPISMVTMGCIRALVMTEIGKLEQTKQLFEMFRGKAGILCVPDANLVSDAEGELYFGTGFIDDYRAHLLHVKISNRKWYAIDRENRAIPVDADFIRSVVVALKA